MNHVPLSEEVVLDRSIPPKSFQSYARLLACGWDGKRLKTVTLTIDELRALWGDETGGVSRATAFRCLEDLQARGLVENTNNRNGRYRLTFPRVAESLKNEILGNESLKNETLSSESLKNETLGSESLKNETHATYIEAREGGAERKEPHSLKNETLGPKEEEESIEIDSYSYLAKLSGRELELAYLKALRQGRVSPGAIPKYARELTAEGPGYLPHLLGHIAYSKSAECKGTQPGVVVCEGVKGRYSAPDVRWLPPSDYDFEQALTWALAGGPPERAPELAQPENEIGEPPPPPPELTPAERMWQTALDQLRLELNKNLYATWLSDTRAVAMDDNEFVIRVPHAYARDWLENRLLANIQQKLAGRAVRFVVQGEVREEQCVATIS